MFYDVLFWVEGIFMDEILLMDQVFRIPLMLLPAKRRIWIELKEEGETHCSKTIPTWGQSQCASKHYTNLFRFFKSNQFLIIYHLLTHGHHSELHPREHWVWGTIWIWTLSTLLWKCSFAFTVPRSPFPCCHCLPVGVHCFDHSLSESHETAFISKVINTQSLWHQPDTPPCLFSLIYSKLCPALRCVLRSARLSRPRDTWQKWVLYTTSWIQQHILGWGAGVPVENQFPGAGNAPSGKSWKMTSCLLSPTSSSLLALLILSVHCHFAISDSTLSGPSVKI